MSEADGRRAADAPDGRRVEAGEGLRSVAQQDRAPHKRHAPHSRSGVVVDDEGPSL